MTLLATITPRLGANGKSYAAGAPERCRLVEAETTEKQLTDREASEGREEGGDNLCFPSLCYLVSGQLEPKQKLADPRTWET